MITPEEVSQVFAELRTAGVEVSPNVKDQVLRNLTTNKPVHNIKKHTEGITTPTPIAPPREFTPR